MELKVVVKVAAITDDRSRRKAMEAVAEIYGIDSISVDMEQQQLTVVGDTDAITIAKKLRKFGKVDILSVETSKEEKKDEMKEENKEEKEEEKKDGKKMIKTGFLKQHIASFIYREGKK